MSLELVVAAVMFTGVLAYAVLGGADFGSGFFDLTAGGDRAHDDAVEQARALAQRSGRSLGEARSVTTVMPANGPEISRGRPWRWPRWARSHPARSRSPNSCK